ncbi:hypothetical protein G6F59_016231 [Rhizopus arrhizus]|nr:hypothetical protein G6F59_016231 [Rhizopus arrhizus]
MANSTGGQRVVRHAKRHQPAHRHAGKLPGARAVHPRHQRPATDPHGRPLPEPDPARAAHAGKRHVAGHGHAAVRQIAERIGRAHLRGAMAVSPVENVPGRQPGHLHQFRPLQRGRLQKHRTGFRCVNPIW